jgi:glycosyltransferase involved in cell wall biosynthesis
MSGGLSMRDVRVLIVVPALNEERSVGDVVRATRALDYDVCVVDDGSTDATAATASAAGASVLRVPLNLGVGGALRCGFRWALANGYDVAVQLDADGQHDPAQIGLLLRRMLDSGADMVIGSRFAPGAGTYDLEPVRKLAMRVLSRRAARMTGTLVLDTTSGFRAIRRPLLDQFASNYPVEYLGDTVEALIEAGKAGAAIVEHPVDMAPRAHGTGSAGAAASIWYVVRVLIATELMHNRRRRRPPRLPSAHGVD